MLANTEIASKGATRCH